VLRNCAGRVKTAATIRSAAVFEARLAHPVPVAKKFDGFHATKASVSNTCLVRFDNNKYSVDSRPFCQLVEIPTQPVQADADRVVLAREGPVALHAPWADDLRLLTLRAGAGA
jgi:hypothetical protein